MWHKESYAGTLTPNAPLGQRTWFRTGGAAEFLFEPKDEKNIALFLSSYPPRAPLYILGAGSNTLVRDGGVKGVVMILPFQHIEVAGERIIAGTNAPAGQVAKVALENGLSGFEFMCGIPGTIGGCLTMNAGAHGGQTADVFVEAHGLDRAGKQKLRSKEEMQFAYRTAKSGLIFTHAEFQGTSTPKQKIETKMKSFQDARKEAQPIGPRTSGSTFKNPPTQKVWQLIEAAGARNFTVGDARVDEKHCNFLVNSNKASATDIETLGEKIRAAVKAHSGITLEWEIKRIGEKQ